VLEGPPSVNPTIKPRWYERGEGASYAIVQHPPPRASRGRVFGPFAYSANSKVDGNYYAQRKKMHGRGELNPRSRLWYHARRPSFSIQP
jgi:hypothetical protein